MYAKFDAPVSVYVMRKKWTDDIIEHSLPNVFTQEEIEGYLRGMLNMAKELKEQEHDI